MSGARNFWVCSNSEFVRSLALFILYIWFIAKSFVRFGFGLWLPVFTERA